MEAVVVIVVMTDFYHDFIANECNSSCSRAKTLCCLSITLVSMASLVGQVEEEWERHH